jgi:5-methylcytosine-specific restriction enzyme A
MKMARIKMMAPQLKILDTRSAKPVEAEKVGDRFYWSREWRDLLASIIARRGRVCEDPQCRTPNGGTKIYGDHIVERKDDPSRELDESNILLRCPSCHGKKTAIERAKRAQRQRI